jgi:hypothetical protein
MMASSVIRRTSEDSHTTQPARRIFNVHIPCSDEMTSLLTEGSPLQPSWLSWTLDAGSEPITRKGKGHFAPFLKRIFPNPGKLSQ